MTHYSELSNFRGHELLFDIECYQNYFLVGLMSFNSGQVAMFEMGDESLPTVADKLDIISLEGIVRSGTLIGFNSKNYDVPMLSAAIQGKTCGQLFELSNALISADKSGRVQVWRTEKKFKYRIMTNLDHIDLMPVAPAAAQMLSLKHYGARMAVPKIQDLPIPADQRILPTHVPHLQRYNVNDLTTTGWLYHYLHDAMKLRREMSATYGTDLRSLSDAQVAEKVIVTEMETVTGVQCFVPKYPEGSIFTYKNPSYIRFYSENLQVLHNQILSTIFVLDGDGKVRVKTDNGSKPATNLWKVKIGKTTYKLGIGGLHSSEKSISHYTEEGRTRLFDRDVASYYPQIIINQNLFPTHLGQAFLVTYKDIVARRLKAKAQGDKATANSLKIAINGSFGKLGSRYSVFYSPELLIQVTLTGQLTLLMLVEMLEWSGIEVVSGNTDGILIKCPQERENAYLSVVKDWEYITSFQTEESVYRSVHARDVNNYIAIGIDGSIKAKGAYTNDLSFKDRNREALMTNPNASIVSEAVMLLLRDNIPVEKTIKDCRDLTKFLLVRRATGGGMKDGVYLGKICRWYIRENDFGCIQTVKPNKAGINAMVSESDGAQPVQTLTDSFPTDLNYAWYINKAKETLVDLGLNNL